MNKWMYNFPGVICEAPDLVKSFEDPESFPALPVFSTQTGVRLIQRDEYYNLYMKWYIIVDYLVKITITL